MVLKISKKNPVVWLVAGGVALLLVAAWLWNVKVSMDPEKVFWGTIEGGLSTRAVTVQAHQMNGDIGVDQTVRYSLGDNRSYSITTLKQAGTEVTSEVIATPTQDYTRYVSIKTDQKRADGSPIDASKILGVWAKGGEGAGRFFPQAVVGGSLPIGGIGAPIGYLPQKSRAELIGQLHNDMTYQVSFDKVKKEKVGGRWLYTYDVSAQPDAYVAMMKRYISSLGLHDLDEVNPEQYAGRQAFKFQITIDARVRQITRIASGDGQEQTYSNYDVPVQMDIPKNAISSEELQKLLSDLQ